MRQNNTDRRNLLEEVLGIMSSPQDCDDTRHLMQSHNIVSFDVGLVMAGLGEQESAIEWLEKAHHERSIEMIYLRVLASPNVYERPFYFLRSNPRFKELLRRMNFSEP